MPTLDELEFVVLDTASGEITHANTYASSFDTNSRTLANEEGFQQTLLSAYEAANLNPPDAPVTLLMPTFFCREMEGAVVSEDDKTALMEALTAEVERFYLFKRSEPAIEFYKTAPNRVFYAAFLAPELEKLVNSFESIAAPIKKIDLSLFAAIRGVLAVGVMQNEVAENTLWALYSISDGAFTISILEGHQLRQSQEVTLSMASFDLQTLATEMRQQTEDLFAKFSITKVLLINSSNHVDGEALASYLEMPTDVLVINQDASNIKSKDMARGLYPCTLEAIGGASSLPQPSLNFLPKAFLAKNQLASLRKALEFGFIGLNVTVFIVGLIVYGIILLFNSFKESEIQAMQQKSSGFQLSGQIKDITVQRFAKALNDENILINDFMVESARMMPKDIWTNKLLLQASDTALDKVRFERPIIEIEGNTNQPDLVNSFASQLSKKFEKFQLFVEKVEPSVSTEGPSTFAWAIKSKELPAEATAQPTQPQQGPNGKHIPGLPPQH
ncbi:MAG: hypothetical protein VKJ06_04140 [Vampirovibrionales bacterium]|nr:hypothetical protein [Vampirovibrionales bacterium]